MKAQRFTDAHRVVVKELAPEAVIRGDLTKLKKMFQGLSSDIVADWPSGGKVRYLVLACLRLRCSLT